MRDDETVLRCYRGACDNSADPRCYNRETHGLYCVTCALKIEEFAKRDGFSLFPLLRSEVPRGGSLAGRQITVRPAQVAALIPKPEAKAEPKKRTGNRAQRRAKRSST